MLLSRLLSSFIAFDPDERPGQGGSQETPPPPAADTAASGQGPDATETFSETFDPSTLDEALQPAYRQMRADYTRKTQEVADQRREAEAAQQLFAALQDPELRPEALRLLGVELPAHEDEDEFDLENLSETRIERLEQVEAQRQAEANAAAQQEAEDVYIDTQLEQLEQQTGREFTDQEYDALEALAARNRDERGRPDVQAAFNLLYEGVLKAERDRWVASKNSPATPPIGQSGSLEIDFNDPEARARAIASLAEAASGGHSQT